MPSLDIFLFVERFFAAVTGFIYSVVGSFAFLARHPQVGPRVLMRRLSNPEVYQVGPLTLHFIVLVLVFAGGQMTNSGRGRYGDFDGADMLERLIPGWDGHVSPELGAVLLSAFFSTAVLDAWARVMVSCGWPDFTRGFPTRVRSRQRRSLVVETRYFAIIPVAISSLVVGITNGVPTALGADLNNTTAIITGVVLALGLVVPGLMFGLGRLYTINPTARRSVGVILVPISITLALTGIAFAGQLAPRVLRGYYEPQFLASFDEAGIPALECSITENGKVSATLLLVNAAPQSIAFETSPSIYPYGLKYLWRKMSIEGLPANTPYLVLRGSEGRAIQLSENTGEDWRRMGELANKSLSKGRRCAVLWSVVGDPAEHYIVGHGSLEDRRQDRPN